MSWDALPPEVRDVAERTCSQDEIDVLKLYSHGMGYRAIARALDIERDTVRARQADTYSAHNGKPTEA